METKPRGYIKDALIVFFLLLICFAYFTQNKGPNENARFALIFSVVKERQLYVDNFYELEAKTGDVAYFNGHYYSDKAIGPAISGAIFYFPIYWLEQIFNLQIPNTGIKWILTILIIGIPSAIAGGLMYILCFWMTGDRFRAYLITLSITLGTMYLPFSITLFSHQLTASLLFSAFFIAFLLKERFELWKKYYLFLFGFLLGWALICEYTSAIIVLPLIVYYLFIIWRNPKLRNLSSITLPMLGGLIPVMLQLIYNKLCFGDYFSVGYSFLSTREHWNLAMKQGFMGINWPNLRVLYYMTLHPLMGVFWMSPVLLLSIIGAWAIFRKHHYQEEFILAVWMICSLFVIMSGYVAWWGGSSVGPRYIIPALPFFCILLTTIPKKFNWSIISLGFISIFQMFIVAASNMKVPDGMVAKIDSLGFFEYSNIYDYCLKQLTEGNFSNNLGNFLMGLNSWSSLIPLFVVIAGLTLIFFRDNVKTFFFSFFHFQNP